LFLKEVNFDHCFKLIPKPLFEGFIEKEKLYRKPLQLEELEGTFRSEIANISRQQLPRASMYVSGI
jgi:hypothetical protein